jgi:hypothetical protein
MAVSHGFERAMKKPATFLSGVPGFIFQVPVSAIITTSSIVATWSAILGSGLVQVEGRVVDQFGIRFL